MTKLRIVLALVLAVLVAGGPIAGNAAGGPGTASMTAQEGGMDDCCGDTSSVSICITVCAPCGSACVMSSAFRDTGADFEAVLAVPPVAAAPVSYLPAPETAPPKHLSV